MNLRELQQIEKKSIFSVKISNELKDSVINNHLNEFSKTFKSNLKRKNLQIFVIEID